LKARFGSHEVINTIMLNFIGIALVSYFIQYHYKRPAIRSCSPQRLAPAHTSRGGSLHSGISERIPLNLAFVSLCFALCSSTSSVAHEVGYELRATGENPTAAEYGGISIRKQIIIA